MHEADRETIPYLGHHHEEDGMGSLALSRRRHLDFKRTASAVCSTSRA
jgi:hypothetical protein